MMTSQITIHQAIARQRFTAGTSNAGMITGARTYQYQPSLPPIGIGLPPRFARTHAMTLYVCASANPPSAVNARNAGVPPAGSEPALSEAEGASRRRTAKIAAVRIGRR